MSIAFCHTCNFFTHVHILIKQKTIVWILAYSLNWGIELFCPVPVESAPMIFSPFWVRIRYFVSLWKHLFVKKCCLRRHLRDPKSKTFEKSAWSDNLRKCLLRISEFLSEPGLLFFTTWWSNKTIFCEIILAFFVYPRFEKPNICASGLAVKEILRCENWVKMRNMDPGSPLRSLRWSKSFCWTWKNPKQPLCDRWGTVWILWQIICWRYRFYLCVWTF